MLDETEPRRNWTPREIADESRSIVAFAVLAWMLATFNLVLVPLVSSTGPGGGGEVIGLFGAAVVSAELSLVAAWGVFGCAPFLVRLARCAGLGFASYLSLVAGLATSIDAPFGEFVGVMLAFLACLPTVFFCVQLPLLAARVWLGWQVLRVGSDSTGSYSDPVTIKDMILATAAGSVALALARLGPALAPPIPSDEFLMLITMWASVAAGASLVSLPPLVFCMLRPRKLLLAVVGVATWFCVTILTGVIAATLLVGTPPSPGYTAVFLGAVFSFVLVLCAGLLITRLRGYRLSWRRESGPDASMPGAAGL